MELLGKKLSLMKEIYALTESLESVAINENYDELDTLLEKRQNIMNQIDDIEKIIKSGNYSSNGNEDFIEKEIQEQLKKIIEIDSKTKLLFSKKEREYRRKFIEIDVKIKTGNYDMIESEQKPKGYYLNTKS